jgi:hypothetical protein
MARSGREREEAALVCIKMGTGICADGFVTTYTRLVAARHRGDPVSFLGQYMWDCGGQSGS